VNSVIRNHFYHQELQQTCNHQEKIFSVNLGLKVLL